MLIEMKKFVNVPYGYTCKSCSALKWEKSITEKPYIKACCYCDITGELLKCTKQGAIKTDSCVEQTLKELRRM